MPQHRTIDPNDCDNCRKLFSALEERQKAAPEEHLTTDDLGRTCGLKRRATQVHLAHLFAHARIDVDRRTPLPGSFVGQPVLPGAQEWAKGIAAPDPTCAKCLIALAGTGWEGQVSMEELAEAAGISKRSAERHRPHLVRADLVWFRPVSSQVNERGFIARQADRYTLLSGFTAPRLTGEALDAVPELAAQVVRSVRWFAGASDDERRIAEHGVGWILANGWPAADVRTALDASKDRNVYRPGGYMQALLRKIPKQYVIPAREIYTGDLPSRMADCAECDRPFKTQRPDPVLCADCAGQPDFEQATPARLIRIA